MVGYRALTHLHVSQPVFTRTLRCFSSCRNFFSSMLALAKGNGDGFHKKLVLQPRRKRLPLYRMSKIYEGFGVLRRLEGPKVLVAVPSPATIGGLRRWLAELGSTASPLALLVPDPRSRRDLHRYDTFVVKSSRRITKAWWSSRYMLLPIFPLTYSICFISKSRV